MMVLLRSILANNDQSNRVLKMGIGHVLLRDQLLLRELAVAVCVHLVEEVAELVLRFDSDRRGGEEKQEARAAFAMSAHFLRLRKKRVPGAGVV